MNTLRKLQYKPGVALLLTVLFIGLLVNNLARGKSSGIVERSARSIYEDRLMPATFLFELQGHMQRQRALLQERQSDEIRHEEQVHQLAVADLVGKYERTKLTPEERVVWEGFKTNLLQFLLRKNGGSAAFDWHFERSISSLAQLSLIQAKEARQLQTDIMFASGASSTLAYLEMALIILLGIATIYLIGYPGTYLFGLCARILRLARS